MVQQIENIFHPSGKIRIIRDVVIVFINVIIVLAILFAGLWPFNFFPQNGCVADFSTGTLLFEKNGIAFTNMDISKDRLLNTDTVFSLAFRVEPSCLPVHCATILAVYNNEGKVLTVNQWKTALIVQSGAGKVVFGQAMKVKSRIFVEMFMNNSFLTVTCGDKTKKIPIDYAGIENGMLKYVVFGNNASLRSPWVGELFSISLNKRKDSFNCIEVPRQLVPLNAKMLTQPWKDVSLERRYALDLIVNLLGFVPLGLSLCLLMNITFPVRNYKYLVAMLVFIISLFIETVQAYLITRTSQMSDLILNSWGGVLGVVLYVIFQKVFRESKSFKNHQSLISL